MVQYNIFTSLLLRINIKITKITPKNVFSSSNHRCHGYQAVVSLVLLAVSSSSSSSSSSRGVFRLIDKTDRAVLDRADGLKRNKNKENE
jgi:hypothetical protein